MKEKTKIAIIGSRFTIIDDSYKNIYYPIILKCLSRLNLDDVEIVSGGAKGIDSVAEKFAHDYGVDFKLFPADWDKYGKSAGMIRNKELINYSNLAIVFWDNKSKGTANSLKLLKDNKIAFRLFDMNGNLMEFKNYDYGKNN